jgi:DNA-binding FadR family transcriptional regulator
MASLFFHLAGATYRDVLEARSILEPIVAGIVARRQNPEQIQALKDYLETSKTTMAGKVPPSPFIKSEEQQLVLEFNAMLMDMAGNPVVTLLARSLQDLRIDPKTGIPGHEMPNIVSVYDSIARAIIEGRPAQAEQLMREHRQAFVEYELENNPAFLEQTVSWR